MFTNFIKLILIYSAIHLGMNVSELVFCHKGQCTDVLQNAYKNVLEIDWKPISVFPEEAKRFKNTAVE